MQSADELMLEEPPLRTRLPRLLALFSALTLAVGAVVAWLLAHEVVRAAHTADALVVRGAKTGEASAAAHAGKHAGAVHMAGTWFHRAADWLTGNAASHAHVFQAVLLAALLGALIALAYTVRRRPESRRPAVAWSLGAACALAPSAVLAPWLVVGIPCSAGLLGAGAIHLKRRSRVTIRGTAIAAREQAVAHAPQLASAAGRTTTTARAWTETQAPRVVATIGRGVEGARRQQQRYGPRIAAAARGGVGAGAAHLQRSLDERRAARGEGVPSEPDISPPSTPPAVATVPPSRGGVRPLGPDGLP